MKAKKVSNWTLDGKLRKCVLVTFALKQVEKFKKNWVNELPKLELKNVKKVRLKFTSNKEIEKNIFNTWSYWIRGWFYEVNESLNLQLEVVWKDLSKAYVKSIKIEKTNIKNCWMRWWCFRSWNTF